MRTSLKLLLPSLAFVVPLGWAGAAQAGIGACGNIHVEASAECEVLVDVECETACQPVAFQAQCAADLYVGCEGQCNASFTAECTASCESDCQVECEASPTTFDCRANCFADASASCEGRCADSECHASCEASAEAECSGRCEVEPAQVDCSGHCRASCEGSCKAEANVDCQIDCQAGGYVDCQAELSGGCRTECDNDGALFCDSQYVDHGGNLEECIDSLRALLDIEVTGYAEGSCSNGHCEGEAGGSISCAVDPEGRGAMGVGALVLLMLGVSRRRRR
jgi:MYXO-CTERM domain-containing protein